MTRRDIFSLIKTRQSYLCVGLDTDWEKIPAHLKAYDDPIFEFNKQIIDATRDVCVAYKPNLAFYEVRGAQGWQSLQKTLQYIGKEHFTIADAKRGDIGNTAKMYAKAFFETLPFDAVTVAPYMGEDSVKPFLNFDQKWVILLALTSNTGAADFQLSTQNSAEKPLYEKVIRKAATWGTPDNLMFVVGATQSEFFSKIRDIVPEHFLLVPGVGEQGGELRKISELALNEMVGLMVNSSRGILYASNGENFAQAARMAAKQIQVEMSDFL